MRRGAWAIPFYVGIGQEGFSFLCEDSRGEGIESYHTILAFRLTP
ncbi:hypothetical protein [Candidatus Hakubella thermalkaliphila]|nr:hypothetical protein [Candidatus Hakubella thermalkaliphila]